MIGASSCPDALARQPELLFSRITSTRSDECSPTLISRSDADHDRTCTGVATGSRTSARGTSATLVGVERALAEAAT
jgi:hypothetical protein